MIDVRGAGERVRAFSVRTARSAFSRRALPAWITACAVAVGIAVLVSAGALDTVQREPDAVAIGTEIELSTYSVTVLDVEVTDAVEEQFLEADPGESLLVVTMLLENLTDATVGVATPSDEISSRLVNASAPLLSLSGVADPGSALVWRDIESHRPPLLQPGVPAEITVAWRVSSSELEGGVSLEVHDAVVRAGQIIVSSSVVTWAQGALVARVDLETAG